MATASAVKMAAISMLVLTMGLLLAEASPQPRRLLAEAEHAQVDDCYCPGPCARCGLDLSTSESSGLPGDAHVAKAEHEVSGKPQLPSDAHVAELEDCYCPGPCARCGLELSTVDVSGKSGLPSNVLVVEPEHAVSEKPAGLPGNTAHVADLEDCYCPGPCARCGLDLSAPNVSEKEKPRSLPGGNAHIAEAEHAVSMNSDLPGDAQAAELEDCYCPGPCARCGVSAL